VAGGGEKNVVMINRARLRGVTNRRRPARIQRDSRSAPSRTTVNTTHLNICLTTQPPSTGRGMPIADEAMTGKIGIDSPTRRRSSNFPVAISDLCQSVHLISDSSPARLFSHVTNYWSSRKSKYDGIG